MRREDVLIPWRQLPQLFHKISVPFSVEVKFRLIDQHDPRLLCCISPNQEQGCDHLIINMPQPILRGDAAWAVSAPPPSPGAEAWRPGRIGD
jgi:hypothetical protein